jgi:aspartate-semialdehyde dehydrogenase
VEELQEQAIHLLNFQQVAHHIFEGQLAFNVLSEPETCQRTEILVRGQFKNLLTTNIRTPRLTVVQAPVFHSHSFSMFVELDSSPSEDQLVRLFEKRLFEKEGSTMILNRGAKDSPSPVSAVGSDKIHIGRISADPVNTGSYSVWMVADNLRVAAAAAIQTAEHIVFAGASSG